MAKFDAGGAITWGYAFDPGDKMQEAFHRHVGIQGRRFGEISNPLPYRHGLLVDIESGDFGAAAGGGEVARQNPHGGGFARAVGSQKAENFPLLHTKGYVLDGWSRAVEFAELLNVDHRRQGVGNRQRPL
jgi:hypothetical protein